MSSEQRTSSAVRNLRSMFENKASLDTDSPDSRGRSPSALSSDKENGGRQTSKVRASFVPVAPAVGMAAATAEQSLNAKNEDIGGGIGVKQAAGQKTAGMEPSGGAVQSTAGAAKEEASPAKPDEPVTSAEAEPGKMKPAEPTNEAAVGGGEALPPVAEDSRSSTLQKETTSSKSTTSKKTLKPAAISTKTAPKPSPSAVKSPARSPLSPPAVKAPTKKPSRSSLTAPTAASIAHMRAAAEKATNSNGQTTSAAKKREVTKPISLPSHLTAPTASSRAKHENPPAASTSTAKPLATTSRPKPTSSARPTPRTSLAAGHRPAPETSQPAAPRRSVAPADSSFLERMMKPTAASASKSHEKPVEAKSPPKTKAAPPKAKVNGVAKKAAASPKTAPADEPAKAEPVKAVEEESQANGESAPDITPAEVQQSVPEPTAATEFVMEESVQEELPQANIEAPKADVTGSQTPITVAEDEPAIAALEATPAGIVGEETIR